MDITKLESLTSAALLIVYNRLSGENVKRFSDRKAGMRRLAKLAEDPAIAAKLEAIVGVSNTTITVTPGEPIPSLAETFEKMADAEAKKLGSKPMTRKERKEALGGLLKKSAETKAKQADSKLVKPIEDSKLVSAGGKVVRPENAEKVLAGEALWGAVKAPPSDKDKLAGVSAGLNLNYPKKAEVKPMREGTKRAKLVAAAAKKGVTIEEVMEMFGLTHAQAVYKLRDLHYMSGHGLEVRNGRVFVLG